MKVELQGITEFLEEYEKDMKINGMITTRTNARHRLRNLILFQVSAKILAESDLPEESSRVLQEIFTEANEYLSDNMEEKPGIYSLTNATEITKLMREANKGAFIDTTIIERVIRKKKSQN